MAKKPNKLREGEIDLTSMLSALDNKNINFWDTLSAEQKKNFPKQAWTFMRYLSSSNSKNFDLDAYYLRSVNEKLNKNFNSIKRHPMLQFLIMIDASPGPAFGRPYHPWITPIKKPKVKNENLWKEIYPGANHQEMTILNQINTQDELVAHLKDMGRSDKEIKQYLDDNE